MNIVKLVAVVTLVFAGGLSVYFSAQSSASAYEADAGVIEDALSACRQRDPSDEVILLCALLELQLEANKLRKK